MPSTVSYVRIRDGRLNRTIPLDASIGTIEIDLSGEDDVVAIPADAPIRVEFR